MLVDAAELIADGREAGLEESGGGAKAKGDAEVGGDEAVTVYGGGGYCKVSKCSSQQWVGGKFWEMKGVLVRG